MSWKAFNKEDSTAWSCSDSYLFRKWVLISLNTSFCPVLLCFHHRICKIVYYFLLCSFFWVAWRRLLYLSSMFSQTECFQPSPQGHISKVSDHFSFLSSGLAPNTLHIFWNAAHRFGHRCSSWGLARVERPLCISCTWHCCLCSLRWRLFLSL